MSDYEELADDEVLAKMKDIRERNAHWKSCQDGSYEYAMEVSGYYELFDIAEERGLIHTAGK